MRRIAALLLAAIVCAALCPLAGATSPGQTSPAAPGPAESAVPEGTGAPETPEDAPFTIDLSIAGDCLLATYRGQYYAGSFSDYAASQPSSYFFEKVRHIFSADDFTLVNLENVLTDRPLAERDKGEGTAYWFKAPAANARILTDGGVEAVSLANNHTGDYGPQGFADTAAAVEAAGLPFGTNEQTVYLEKNGFIIAVICHGLWNEGQASQIVRRIEEASAQSDYQIVLYHGGAEGVHQPEDWRVRASRRLADAGADLVLGSHPHVLQPEEVYNGVPIVYSLGNFCYGGNRSPENRTVIYKVLLTVEDGRVVSQATDMVPCYVYTGSTNNWQPAPITDEAERQRVLDFMGGTADAPF